MNICFIITHGVYPCGPFLLSASRYCIFVDEMTFLQFIHVGEVNEWNEAPLRAATTSTPKDIVTSYQRGVRGHGLKAIAKAHQVPTATIQHVLARAEQWVETQPHREGTRRES